MAIKSKKIKLDARAKSKLRIRKKVSGTGERPRISVYRSSKHTYAQLISDATGETLVSASTNEPDVIDQISKLNTKEAHSQIKSAKSVNAAKAVGIVLAKRSKEKGFTAAIFDRNGFLYHGRIRAVAEGAREGGLEF